jgi:fluoride exporter
LRVRRVDKDFVGKFTFLYVFLGGALGAVLRELLMLIVPEGPRGFPLDILAANVVASFVLGLVTSLHSRKAVSDGVHSHIAIGLCGGLSTFSSFTYASVVLMRTSMASALIAIAYVLTSLVSGYIAVIVGLKLGKQIHNAETPGAADSRR